MLVWTNAERMVEGGTLPVQSWTCTRCHVATKFLALLSLQTLRSSVTCGMQNTLSRKTFSWVGECGKGLEVGGRGAECELPEYPVSEEQHLPPLWAEAWGKGFSSSPWHYLFWICGCHILHGTWWMSMNSGKATEWPGGWKGSVPGVSTAQLDVALNAILWAFCGRSDQTHLPPPVPSPLKYSVIQWLCWLINQDGLVCGGLSCIKVLLFCSFAWNHRHVHHFITLL